MVARHGGTGREALSRLQQLDIRELRQEWSRLYKVEASPYLSRELLIRAVSYRLQEVASGGLRPELRHQLHQIAQELKQNGVVTTRLRSRLKFGTRLLREWRGQTYEVVVLDDGFSWEGMHYHSLTAVARKITGTAWSGPLFFGLKQRHPTGHRLLRASVEGGDLAEGADAAS
jgi:hypothetical protein